MSLENHIQSLRAKHSQLKNEIHNQRTHPQPNDQIIAELKYQKLKIKDEISMINCDQ